MPRAWPGLCSGRIGTGIDRRVQGGRGPRDHEERRYHGGIDLRLDLHRALPLVPVAEERKDASAGTGVAGARPGERRVVDAGRPYRGLRPLTPEESKAFAVLLRGEWRIQGFRNVDLRRVTDRGTEVMTPAIAIDEPGARGITVQRKTRCFTRVVQRRREAKIPIRNAAFFSVLLRVIFVPLR